MSEGTTCPTCGMTSYHPGDRENQWCANCQCHYGEAPNRYEPFRPTVWQRIKELFTGIPAREPVQHDYQNTGWGHALHFARGTDFHKPADISGHGPAFGPKIQTGDWIIAAGHGGGIFPLKVKSVEYCRDPHDMFHATVVFDPKIPLDPRYGVLAQ